MFIIIEVIFVIHRTYYEIEIVTQFNGGEGHIIKLSCIIQIDLTKKKLYL